jgi:hypothetical protein
VLIEITRKLVAEDASMDVCAICGNDFELESVHAVASGDKGEEVGPMCPTCLGYLNRRKGDAEDPALRNWPARGWPSVEVLEEARLRHPEPMFGTGDDLLAAATDRAADDSIYAASVVWGMDREDAPA